MARICRITPVINKQSRQTFALSHSELVESQLFKDLNNILKKEFDIKDDIDRRTALVDIWDNYRDVEYQIVTDNYIDSTLEPNAYDVLNYLYNNDLLPSALNIEPVEIEGKLREGRTIDVNSIYRKVISDKNIDTNIPAWKYRLRLNSDEARTFVKQMGALLITNLNSLQQQIQEREQWYESRGQSKTVTVAEALWTMYSQAAKSQLDRTGQRSRYAENMFRKFRAEWFSPDLKLYKAFQRYMNKLYGISFIDLETKVRKNELRNIEKQGVETVQNEDLDTEIEDSEDDLQESYWDGTQTLKVNRQDKIQRLVKFELAKIVIPEDVEAGGRKGIAYVPYYMDINEVWLSLINAHRYDLTTEDMLDTLERLSKVSPAFNTLYQRFNKVYKRLHQGNNQENTAEIDSRDLNSDENFLHAYQYSVMGTMSEVISLDINPADKKISLVYPNRNSSPIYPVYDKAVNVFENVKNYYDELLKRKTSIMSDDDTGMYAFTEMLHYIETNYYNRKDFADPAIYNKEVLLAKAFNLLGIPVTREGLHAYGEYYIKQVYAEDGIPSNFEDYYESLLEKGVFDAGNGVMIRNKNRNSDTESWAKSAYKKLTDPYLEKIYDKIYMQLRTVYRTMTERQYLNEEDTRQARGILFKLASVATFEADTKIQAGYMDVNQSLNYTYQQDSYITKLFKPFSYRHAGVMNQNKIIEVFRPFLDDKTLANSPFLYCDELIRIHRAENMIENSRFPAASYGLFRVKENADGSKSITVNQAFASSIQLSLYNGFRNITTLTGIKYVDSLDAQWLFQHLVMAMNNRYIISSSDSAKMYTITIPPIAMQDMEIALKKILKNGLASFRRGQELCFNQTDNGFRVKNEKELNKLHQNLYAKNGKVLDDNGHFIGKAFQFLELQGNKGETFLEYLRRNLLTENEKDTKLFNYSDAQIETHFGAFVKDVVAAQRDKIDSMTKAIKPFLESYKFDGETVNTRNNRGGFIYEAGKNLLSDNAKLSKIPKKATEESDIEDLTEIVKKIESTQEQYRDEVLAAQLNAMINQIEFSYLMYGKMGEYKNSLDWNKRVGQIVKVGGNIYEDENNPTYDILIIDDIVVKSNLKKVLGLNDDVKKMHDVDITTTDGYSFILDDEYERLMRFQGKWNKVEKYVNDMRDLTKIVNPADYHHVTEQLKTFIYDRLPVVLPNGETEMRSIQNKDSTGVFFERMAIGTQLEPLYKWLKAHPNIRKVAFASGVKVSGARPVTVFDANGNFVEPNTDDVQNATVTVRYKATVNQQDVHPALLDSDISAATQLDRYVFSNLALNESVYELNGKKLTGKEIRDRFHQLKGASTVEQMYETLQLFGVINENGNIKTDGSGIPQIDLYKLREWMMEYATDDLADVSLINALQSMENGMPAVPYSMPMVYSLFKKVLLAKFNKNTKLRAQGLHIPLRPEVFTKPAIPQNAEVSEIIKSLRNSNMISWSKEILERASKASTPEEVQKAFELQTEYTDKNGVFHPAECLLNANHFDFYSDFVRTKNVNGTIVKYIDIDSVPEFLKEFIGYRTPSEGKNSSSVMRVVGYINTGSSNIIMPSSLMTRTGWDFDIDTLYVYDKTYKRSYSSANNSVVYTEEKIDYERFSTDNQPKINMLTHLYKTRLRSRYEAIMFGESKSEILTGLNSINNDLENLASSSLISDYTELLSQINESLPAVRANINMSQEAGNRATALDSLETMINRFNSKLTYVNTVRSKYRTLGENGISLKEFDFYKDRLESLINDAADLINAFNYTAGNIKPNNVRYETVTNSIFTKQDENNKLLVTDYNSDATVKNMYDKEDIMNLNTQEARDNEMMNIRRAILSNPQHLNELYKNNEFAESIEIAKAVNELWDNTVDVLNPMDIYNQQKFHDLNMSSRVLKGIAVMGAGTILLSGQLGVQSSKAVTHYYTFEELGLEKSLKAVGELESKYGVRIEVQKELIEKEEGGRAFVILSDTLKVESSTIGWSDSVKNRWNDLSGKPVSWQLGQLTSHILDSVKYLMGKNTTKTTLPTLIYLSSTNITGQFNGKWNRFAYGNAFIHQPIIVQLNQQHSIDLIDNPLARFGNNMQVMTNAVRISFAFELQCGELIR